MTKYANRRQPDANTLEVTVGETLRAISTHEAHVVDVREPDEWMQGHIVGALHIPLGDLKARLNELPTGHPVIFVCRSGRRSLIAAKLLAETTGGDGKSLAGGMLDWVKSGQPVQK